MSLDTLSPNAKSSKGGLNKGAYYCLEPIDLTTGKALSRNILYLPVAESISVAFSTNWTEGDTLAKDIISAVRGDVLVNALDKANQGIMATTGAGGVASASAIYGDSPPPTFNLSTKMFSPFGSSSPDLLKLAQTLKTLTTPTLTSGGSGRVSFRGATVTGVVGTYDIPKGFNVSVIGPNGSVFLSMRDMICQSLNITLFTPFYDQDPQLMEVTMSFRHILRHFNSTSEGGPVAFGPQTKPAQTLNLDTFL